MNRVHWRAAFSLPELMVAMAVGSIMLGGLMVTATNLQRWFAAADFLIACQQDEATALDYLARDIKRASSILVENGDRKLTLSIPDQSLRAADGSLQPPTVSLTGLRYGTQALTVAYLVQGNAFVRQEGATTLTLSTKVDEFHADATALPAVQLQLVFKPGPRRTAGLRVTTTVRQRNLAARLQ